MRNSMIGPTTWREKGFPAAATEVKDDLAWLQLGVTPRMAHAQSKLPDSRLQPREGSAG